MPFLMSCSVQFSVVMFFQTTSEINSLLCLAEFARLSWAVLIISLTSAGSISCSTRTVGCSVSESDNDKSPVIVKKCRLTPDIFRSL